MTEIWIDLLWGWTWEEAATLFTHVLVSMQAVVSQKTRAKITIAKNDKVFQSLRKSGPHAARGI